MCYVWPCCCENRLELTTNSTGSKGNTKGAAKVSRSVRSRITRNCKNRRCDKHTNGETCRGKDTLSSSSKCHALFTIQPSNTCRLFQNVRMLLAALSKGTALREEPTHRQEYLLKDLLNTTRHPKTPASPKPTENKTRRKVNPLRSDAIPAKC